MANFNPAFLTTKGLALLTKAQAGKTTILFTKAKTGEGDYIGDETPHPEEQTDLKASKQEFPISTITISDNTTVYLKFIASNYQDQIGLAEGYHVKEVGIFAEDPEEGEILYALAVAVEEQWDYMPAYNNLLPSTITMEFYTTVANATEVYLKAGSGAYVCQEDFEAYKAEMTETIEDMSKNNEVEFDDISEPSEVPDPAEALEQIASGKSVPVLIGHIKTTLRGILALAQRAMNVAVGRNQARVFATVEALDEWLSLSENTEQLNVGDNFYITATEVPDYWWDGTSKQPLETQKVDLTGYDQQISALQAADREINGNITALQNLMQSFNAAKSKIISSALGAALGLTANIPLADVAAKVAAVVNRGTLNWSGSNTTFAVPAGYYPGGTLDSRPSYNSGYNAGVTAADNRANVNSANYKAGYNAGVAAGKTSYSIVPYSKETSGTLVNSYSLTVPSGKTRAIVIASAHIVNHNLNNGISCTGGSTITEKIICKKDGSYDYCSYYRECTVSPGNVLTITASNTGSTHAIYSSGCVVFI